jgi:hypothetical protein
MNALLGVTIMMFKEYCMKKTNIFGLIAFIMGVMLIFAFTACGDGSGDNGNGNGTGTAPTVTTASLPNGTVGTAYSQTLTATGDTPITWSLATGSLPGGLTLSTAGVISGNPTTANTFNFTVKATNAKGNNTKPLSITIASGGGGNAGTYIITGSGTTFTATKNNATVGTANQDIETVITAIRTDANGSNCTIQFGDGTNVLDLGIGKGDSGIGYVKFNNDGGTWGIVTITGKITSANNSCTIRINGPSVVSTADIANTHVSGGNAISIHDGTVTISGGTVSSNSTAIYNSGTMTITGGTVSATSAAIYNSFGTTTISGGTISANTYAVYNSSDGTVTINGGTVSGTISNSVTLIINNGTISGNQRAIENNGTATINGGTITATSSRNNATAVSNSGGTVTITGGTVSATSTGTDPTVYTVYNENSYNGNSGTITITGGTVSATGTGSRVYAVYNSGGTVTITTPPTVIDKTKTSGTITWLP